MINLFRDYEMGKNSHVTLKEKKGELNVVGSSEDHHTRESTMGIFNSLLLKAYHSQLMQ